MAINFCFLFFYIIQKYEQPWRCASLAAPLAGLDYAPATKIYLVCRTRFGPAADFSINQLFSAKLPPLLVKVAEPSTVFGDH
jgi:hypothetical protein